MILFSCSDDLTAMTTGKYRAAFEKRVNISFELLFRALNTFCRCSKNHLSIFRISIHLDTN